MNLIASTRHMQSVNSIFMFHFDIVGGCQLRCVGCPNSTLLPKVKQIDLDVFDACLRNVDVDYVHTLRLFNFGEPLLHKHFSKILEIVADQRWKPEHVEISTNAQHVYWEDFERALSLNVLTKLVVSCDGDATAASYERLRPPSKWSKFLAFLDRTSALRDDLGSTLTLATRSVVQSQHDVQAWQALLHPKGWQTEFRTWKVLPESAVNMTGRSIEVPAGMCTFVAPSDRFTHRYHGALEQLYVDWDGTVVPCCVHPRAGELGDLKVQTASEVINGEQKHRFTQQMDDERQAMSICGQCEYGPPENPGPSFEDHIPAD